MLNGDEKIVSSQVKQIPKYSFTSEDDSSGLFAGFSKIKDLLRKWGMLENMYVKRFHYDQVLREQYDNMEMFIKEFVNSPNVNPWIKVKAGSNGWATLGKVNGVKLERVKHTATSMDLFDSIYKTDVIRPTGEIKKCLGIKNINDRRGHSWISRV